MHGEQRMGLVIQIDRVVGDPRLGQQLLEFRPDFIVPAPVFGLTAALNFHHKSMTRHVTLL